MNIPKPAIWAGLAALVGVYIFMQPKPEGDHDESTHTHADGSTHSGSEHSSEEAASTAERTDPRGGASATTGKPVADPKGKLQLTDTKVGTGATATEGKSLTMHYRGTLLNGKQFDASYDRGQPFTFTLGSGQVIKGWDLGIKGMKVGGERKLVIPADLAYGEQSPSPNIPPNSPLVFEVKLLDVK
jgi:FKBP-type peptidyl-prolyl cis-trans isomerase